ncbi:MAG: FGGY family carbohydrate kinase [Sulfuricaulis sp.]
MTATSPDPLYLCIDQGGQASRALVFDGDGVRHVRAQCTVGVHYPRLDWVEQDPEELVTSIRAVVAETIALLGDRADRIVNVGIASQRSSVVCWDRRTGEALSPVISWQDRRANAWLSGVSASASEIHQYTGLRLSAHYGASKLRWCLDHLPAVTAAQRAGHLAMGPLASFLLFRLLESKPLLTDPANAARTLLWNIRTHDWDSWLLELFGIPLESLPRCVPTRHDFGMLPIMERRIPLAIATGDQSAALFAQGTPAPDAVYINLGTGAFLQRIFQRVPEAAGLLTGVAYQTADQVVFVLEASVNGAAAALRWAEKQFDLQDVETQLPDWLARAGDLPLFLNGVAGLGAPYWIADFPSRLIGGGAPWQRVCAVAESVVFLLQVNLEVMRNFSPPPTRIIVTGGLARLDALCQRLADLSRLPVLRSAEYEATARGTAYLLAGLPGSWPENQPPVGFKPKSDAALVQRYQRWCVAMRRALGLE